MHTIALPTEVTGLRIAAPLQQQHASILTPEALYFVKALHDKFNARRLILLAKRKDRQHQLDRGKLPDFLVETAHIRSSEWKVAPVPEVLQDRRVEITGPVDRKMIINALNSGAKVFMADFEDSNSPSWNNLIDGQLNLRDAIRGTISYTQPETGKHYALNDSSTVLFVRPRGWHLPERHITIEDEEASGSLVDFGLYFFHNAHALIERGRGPFFYLPKIESHLEARLWNDVFEFAQSYMEIPRGTIKATVLIETILASFVLHEILYELRHHSAGLNCGRWDYIFSYIKKLHKLPGYVLPERGQVTMSVPCMDAYSRLVIQTCHKRGAHAMGGMSAVIPVKHDAAANEEALQKVRDDKKREALNGHDGTWVAHPALVSVAQEVFDTYMKGPNQLDKALEGHSFTANELLTPPSGTITEQGLRTNINVGILYIESWLRGYGAAALYHLMEDAATAEISRSQVWQWIHTGARLADGRRIDTALYQQLLQEELVNIQHYVGAENYANGKFAEAVQLFDSLVLNPELEDFLTVPAYGLLA